MLFLCMQLIDLRGTASADKVNFYAYVLGHAIALEFVNLHSNNMYHRPYPYYNAQWQGDANGRHL